MKNSFLFALAISVTLMITTSGCKHGGVGRDPITGTTTIPHNIGDNTIGDATKNPRTTREVLPPINTQPGNEITKIEPPVAPPATNDPSYEGPNRWTKTWDDPNLTPDADIFKDDVVYFELDSAVVRSTEQSKLERIAAYFKNNNTDVLMVEGHCDERGTEQYNLSLGDRRALAVREYLMNLGVESGRIHTVSFGESRPVDPAHNEAAWSKNRRGVSILMRPGKQQ